MLDHGEVADRARALLPIHRAAWVVERARASLRERTVRLGAQRTAPIDRDALWEYGDDRARGRHAHGFTFLVDWVGAAAQLTAGESTALSDLVAELYTSWDRGYGQHRATAPEMAFHDETTAQRLLGLVSVLDELSLSEEQRRELTELAARTATLLREPDFYGGVNNHGMFQDLALLAWAGLVADGEDPARQESWDLAEQRLQDYFLSCFTSDGVHVENTPTYHVMVSRYLPLLDGLFTAAGSPTAGLFHRLRAGATRYAVHCVTPEALYPPVSDTHRRRLDSVENLETFVGGEFEYAATAGERGRKPLERTATFPASGYAVTRSAWGDPAASFIHFTCAYNANYHKHSDEGSIYLRSGGRDLLCESGAYGYNWQDPFTRHAYASAAHNTLIVDGTGLPRTEPDDVRFAAEPPLNELEVETAQDDLLEVTGTTRRYRGRVWQRRLRVDHGDSPSRTRLHLEDTVSSSVGTGALRFLWHLGPGLRVKLRADGAEVFDRLTKLMEIEFRTEAEISLQLLEGVEKPSPQGWSFPEFGERVPAPVILVESRAADFSMATEVRLDGFVWDEEERGTFETLVINTRTVPTSSLPGSVPDQSVLFLSPYRPLADRDRLLTELVKAGVPVRYVPGIPDRISHAGSVELAEAAVRQFATAAIDHIRREAARGISVTVATAGKAFAPGAIAAFSTRSPLITLDPQLPFRARDPRTDRLAARIEGLVAGCSEASADVVVSSDEPVQVQRAVTMLGSALPVRRDLSALLKADVEDAFSDMIVNSVLARTGDAILYTAVYDRRTRAFLVNLPEFTDVEMSVRVFQGKTEVHVMPYSPYTAGTSLRVPFTGKGPHRLRIHLRDPKGGDAAAFTTGTLRVR